MADGRRSTRCSKWKSGAFGAGLLVLCVIIEAAEVLTEGLFGEVGAKRCLGRVGQVCQDEDHNQCNGAKEDGVQVDLAEQTAHRDMRACSIDHGRGSTEEYGKKKQVAPPLGVYD